MCRPSRVGHTMAMRQGQAAATTAILTVVLLAFDFAGAAQNASNSEIFKARLSPVPINLSMMATIAGSGSLTATLSGKQLTIQGTFEGLRSPATSAQIHRGPKGIPGPVIAGLDLTVSKAEKGAIGGSLDLTPDQIADLRNGRLYVQIQSERAPDGNLWGWLLK
jgi:CHRD domain-containing protein